MKRMLWIGLLLAWAARSEAAPGENLPPLAEILARAADGAGLCVVLGAGSPEDPSLSADLAADGRWLVHGLAGDRGSAERAREIIAKRGLTGHAMVEYPMSGPLPYARNLADAVVIADSDAMAKTGVSIEDARRIAVPGGTLFTRQAGAWKRETKPRSPALDRWTHVRYGPGDEFASRDGEVTFPGALRWVDGIPMNLDYFIACRGLVVDERRIYALTSAEPENAGRKWPLPMYLVARNAFNGLIQWKTEAGYENPCGALASLNTMALATDGQRVYCNRGKELVGLDGATGKVAVKYANRYPAARLFVLDGMLVASQWESRGLEGGRGEWFNDGSKGAVQAFEAATGQRKWEANMSARWLLGADGNAYLLAEPAGANIVQVGQEKAHVPVSQEVVAIDMQTGRERWRVSCAAIAPDPDVRFHFCLAGGGVLLLEKAPPARKQKGGQLIAISARDGSVLWEKDASSAFLANGELLIGGQPVDPLTGKQKSPVPFPSGGGGRRNCTPDAMVAGRWGFRTRDGGGIDLSEPDRRQKKRNFKNSAARGPCGIGFIPANGLYYVAQNKCGCCPPQIRGMLAFGAAEKDAEKADFEAARSVERGPAFGAVKPLAIGPDDWPEFLGGAERSSRSDAVLGDPLKVLWTTQVTGPSSATPQAHWEILDPSALTAPACAYGMVFVAVRESGQVAALDLATGRERWRHQAGARIRMTPTLGNGYCFFGTQDGWVQAMRATDGVLAWRARVAPIEQRMVAFGRIESPWPALGVGVWNGTLFAVAGRNSENRGVALCALDPATGDTRWARHLDRGAIELPTAKRSGHGFQGDVPMVRQHKVCVSWMALEQDTGRFVQQTFDPATTPSGLVPGIQGLVNDTERLLRVGRDADSGAQFRGLGGRLFAWDDQRVYVQNNQFIQAYAHDALGAPAGAKSAAQPVALWKQAPGPPHAMAVCANRLVITRSQTVKDAQIHMLEVLDPLSGKSAGWTSLEGPPSRAALAVARGRALVSLDSGKVACVGNER